MKNPGEVVKRYRFKPAKSREGGTEGTKTSNKKEVSLFVRPMTLYLREQEVQ